LFEAFRVHESVRTPILEQVINRVITSGSQSAAAMPALFLLVLYHFCFSPRFSALM
jgi:hypothetical protein